MQEVNFVESQLTGNADEHWLARFARRKFVAIIMFMIMITTTLNTVSTLLLETDFKTAFSRINLTCVHPLNVFCLHNR